MSDKPRRRQLLSFSVRTLLLVVLSIGIAASWFSRRLQIANLEKESVAAIEQLGGQVRYDYQEAKRVSPSGPEWLRSRLGTHFFDRAVWVAFSSPGRPIDQVTNIEFLTDLDRLSTLYLDWTAVRDLSTLADKYQLRFLSVHHTEIEDLSPLAQLAHLETINLSRTNVTDLSALGGKKLKQLWMRGTNVSDISVLAGMDSLVVLDLYKTKVNDVSALSSAKNLETLSINWTEVSDIQPLMNLQKLTSLDVGRTEVSEGSVRDLKAALPNCVIKGR